MSSWASSTTHRPRLSSFGCLSKIKGLDSIFNGEPENEATALFTFVTNANTDRVIVNGPFKILNRNGTTTIYLNTPPSDFSNPSTFSQEMPIQVSTRMSGAKGFTGPGARGHQNRSR